MKLYPGDRLTSPISDLYIEIHKVGYVGKDYIKVKASLKYKSGVCKDFAVETKNYKLFNKNISHLEAYHG